MKEFLKKHRLDTIIISILIVASLISSIVILSTRNNDSLKATIYHHDEVVEVIDLSKESDNREIVVNGDKGEVIVEVKKNSIRVKNAECPHHDCVNMGWVSSTNRPIICAYNAISIVLNSKSSIDDIEV